MLAIKFYAQWNLSARSKVSIRSSFHFGSNSNSLMENSNKNFTPFVFDYERLKLFLCSLRNVFSSSSRPPVLAWARRGSRWRQRRRRRRRRSLSCINQFGREADNHLHCNIVVAPQTVTTMTVTTTTTEPDNKANTLDVCKFISPFPVCQPKNSHQNESIQAV